MWKTTTIFINSSSQGQYFRWNLNVLLQKIRT